MTLYIFWFPYHARHILSWSTCRRHPSKQNNMHHVIIIPWYHHAPSSIASIPLITVIIRNRFLRLDTLLVLRTVARRAVAWSMSMSVSPCPSRGGARGPRVPTSASDRHAYHRSNARDWDDECGRGTSRGRFTFPEDECAEYNDSAAWHYPRCTLCREPINSPGDRWGLIFKFYLYIYIYIFLLFIV